MSRMYLEHFSARRAQSRFYCGKLLKDVDAIAVFLHHLGDAARLPLDAAHACDLLAEFVHWAFTLQTDRINITIPPYSISQGGFAMMSDQHRGHHHDQICHAHGSEVPKDGRYDRVPSGYGEPVFKLGRAH